MDSRFVAMLALEQRAHVDGPAIIDQIRRQFREFKADLSFPPREQGIGKDALPLFVNVGTITVAIAWADFPIPGESLDPAIEADHVWPEAKTRLAAHKSHLEVGSVKGAGDWEAAADAAVAVTLVAAALVALLPCIGVYWAMGLVVTEASRFQEEAAKMVEGRPPIDVWMQFRWVSGPPAVSGQRTVGLSSTGLRPFFEREIEFEPSTWSPLDIGARVFGLIMYLLAKGPVVQDGDLVGETIPGPVIARYASEGMLTGIPVIKLSVGMTGNVYGGAKS